MNDRTVDLAVKVIIVIILILAAFWLFQELR